MTECELTLTAPPGSTSFGTLPCRRPGAPTARPRPRPRPRRNGLRPRSQTGGGGHLAVEQAPCLRRCNVSGSWTFRLVDAALVAVLLLVLVTRLEGVGGVGVDGGGGVDGDVDFAVNPSADPDDDDEYSSAMASAPLEKSSCSACRVREARNQSLETIKLKILSKLNLRQAPNMTGRPLPDLAELRELLERSPDRASAMLGDDPGTLHSDMADDDDDYSARTQRVIAFAQPHPHPKLRHRSKGQHLLMFRFSPETMHHSVTEAHLWIWVRGGNGSLTVEVYRMRRGDRGDRGDGATGPNPTPHLETSSKQPRPSGRGGWVAVDVRRLLETWFRRPQDNLGLLIRATDSSGRPVAISVPVSTPASPNGATEESGDGTSSPTATPAPSSSPTPNLSPFVEVFTTDGGRRRPKRTLSLSCNENSDETRCCRYPLTVDFEEFGWDFIIAPKKYEANYCAGECPHVFLQRYPHTHLVHMANPSGTRGPCCGPRKMSAISMLYFDEDYNIIYGLLPGMVVDRCGCA